MPRKAKKQLQQPAMQRETAAPEEVNISSNAQLDHEDVVEAVASLQTPNKRKSSPVNDVKAELEETASTASHNSKRQKLAVRTRDDSISDGHRRTHIEMEFVDRKRPRSREEQVADSQEEDGDEDEIDPSSASKQLEEEASQRSPSALTEETPLKSKRQPKSKHVVFGDDHDVSKYVAVASAKTPQVEDVEEEEDDDDDDAPEAVSNKAAAETTLKTAQAAEKAAERQAESQKRKRQARDALFKEQGQKSQKRVKQPSLRQGGSPYSKDNDGIPTLGSERTKRDRMPHLLPAEFLEDSSSDEEEDEAAFKAVQKPKKITFKDAERALADEMRAPQDEVVGSTIYRVIGGKESQSLAPRLSKRSQSMRHDLLKRNRRKVVATAGKKKGFFVKK